MNDMKWIPLGSVVVWNNSTQKILVIGRGLNVRSDDENEYYFDYCGVVYPEGLIGDRILYFNHDAVDRILFEGYDDDDNKIMNDRISQYIDGHANLKRISTAQ